MFYENLWLDFMLPSIENLSNKHGKGDKKNEYNKKFKDLLQKMIEKYKDKLEKRKEFREIMDQQIKENQEKELRQKMKLIDENNRKTIINNSF